MRWASYLDDAALEFLVGRAARDFADALRDSISGVDVQPLAARAAANFSDGLTRLAAQAREEAQVERWQIDRDTRALTEIRARLEEEQQWLAKDTKRFNSRPGRDCS
mmetsp:Transcript_107885/g.191112  ORF Transcript_107885/g.191112 Transcript_107885/m.191112 type:complete len:107 (+) Transcript_107885:71-391(+)